MVDKREQIGTQWWVLAGILIALAIIEIALNLILVLR